MRKIYYCKKSKSMSLTVDGKPFRASFDGGSSFSGYLIPHQFITDDEAVQKALEAREDFKNGAVWCVVLKEEKKKDPKVELPAGGANENPAETFELKVIPEVTNGQQAKKALLDLYADKGLTLAPTANNSVTIDISDKYNVQFPNWESWKLAHDVE